MGKVEKRIIAPGRVDPALPQDGVRCALTSLALHGGPASALGSLAHSAKGQRRSLHVRMSQAQAQSPGMSLLCHGGSRTAAGQVNLLPQWIASPCLFPHRVSGDEHFAVGIVVMVNCAAAETSQKTWNRDPSASEFCSWLCPLIYCKLRKVQSEGDE